MKLTASIEVLTEQDKVVLARLVNAHVMERKRLTVKSKNWSEKAGKASLDGGPDAVSKCPSSKGKEAYR